MATPIRAIGFDFNAKAGVSYEIREIEAWAQGRNVVLNQTIVGQAASGGNYSLLNDGSSLTIYSDTGSWFSVQIDTDATDILHIDHYSINVEIDGNPTEWDVAVSDSIGQFGSWHGVDSRADESWADEKSFGGPFFFDDPFVSINDSGSFVAISSSPGNVPQPVIDSGSFVAISSSPGLPSGANQIVDPGLFVSISSAPGLHVAAFQVVDPGVLISISSGAPWVSVQPNIGAQITTIYQCTLEPAGDPSNAITLPIQSFQTRLQDILPTWLQVVAPNIVDRQTEIADRLGGVLRVYQGTRDQDGNETWLELAWCNLEQYQIQIGAKSSTAILGGHGDEPNTSPKQYSIQNISYTANNAGIQQVRAAVDRNLRPGDTATWAGGQMLVGQVQHSVGQFSSQMDVFEAVPGG